MWTPLRERPEKEDLTHMKPKNNELFKNILGLLCVITIVLGAPITITGVWIREAWIWKLLLTDVIVFVLGLFLYWILYYEEDEK